ncbi:DUF397 domain-containing protein [Streptomyces sp. CBMA29]|uniref:DUF397 domain-containing protein n=1 Tax=Streptomyces sp. CBMA29 TaxID=1896314 RepID=UPI001661E9DC|nr:DUF397 domain-containing protein [Streptomyces sp. CBMA29]MBD0734037.1 hypothetical protein [Streptomyces sp. CBMA29]
MRLETIDLTDAAWFKASASQDAQQACVEVTPLVADGHTAGMAVRDSKDPQGPVLRFSADAWTAFAEFAGQKSV